MNVTTLFFVEDEKTTRDSIRNNIHWESHDIEYIGDAMDGELALPQILEKKPNILLCDIRMPYMDGLELVRLVKDKFPDIKIIILSGYDKFDYAQKAIQLGVSEYLLKPVSSADVLNSVLRVKKSIDEKRLAKETIAINKQEALLSKRFLLMNELCTGTLSNTSDILRRARETGISLSAGAYQIILAKTYNATEDTKRNVCLESSQYISFQKQDGIEVYLLKAQSEQVLSGLRKQVVKKFEEQENVYQFFVEGTVVFRLTHVSDSYYNACFKFQSKIDFKNMDGVAQGFQINRNEIVDFLRNGTKDKVEHFWKQYDQIFENAIQSMVCRLYFYAEVFFAVSEFEDELGIPTSERMQYDMAPLYSFPGSNTQETEKHMKHVVYDMCRDLMEIRDSRNAFGIAPFEKRAKNYIKQHYSNPTLSLSDVATAVNMSPNYFSTIFKNQTNFTFSQYLMDTRIEQAKKLLRYTSLRIGEVAYKSGYENVNYFSMIFKKKTGMSPSQFRVACDYKKKVYE